MLDKSNIVKLKIDGLTYAAIARIYGVSRQRIHQIICYKKRYFRKSILNKLKGRCFSCRKKTEKLQGHHLNGDRKNNEENNLFFICIRCHKNVHYRINYLAYFYKPSNL
ncbi:MAG: helix-turn-helix domain-containing protein [Nanoarchaeota archaeon]